MEVKKDPYNGSDDHMNEFVKKDLNEEVMAKLYITEKEV